MRRHRGAKATPAAPASLRLSEGHSAKPPLRLLPQRGIKRVRFQCNEKCTGGIDEKISVSDICNDCGINRKSFYYHFRDKYDLVNWIFYVGFVGGMDVVNYENVWDLLSDILHYFYSEREFYYAALQIEGQNSFRDYLVETMTPVAEFFLRNTLPDNQDDDFYITFILDALLASLIRWLSGEYRQSMDADAYILKLRDVILKMASSVA